MPPTGHTHRMEPLAWSIPASEWTPRVLFGCTAGVCAQTEVVAPTERSRAVPKLVTPGQFTALRAGKHWPEIVGSV